MTNRELVPETRNFRPEVATPCWCDNSWALFFDWITNIGNFAKNARAPQRLWTAGEPAGEVMVQVVPPSDISEEYLPMATMAGKEYRFLFASYKVVLIPKSSERWGLEDFLAGFNKENPCLSKSYRNSIRKIISHLWRVFTVCFVFLCEDSWEI